MMTTAFIAGLILGLRYRWPALFGATLVVIVGGCASAPFLAWTVAQNALGVVSTVVALQFGYLSGLAIIGLQARYGSRREVSRAAQPARR